jgi:hypothetical protein
MNCEKCANPRLRGGGIPKKPKKPLFIGMVKIGTVFECDRYQCPVCHAIQLYPRVPAQFEQLHLPAFA